MTIHTRILLPLFALLFLVSGSVQAQNNPYSGYSGYTNSYFLDYVGGTGFGPANTSDIQVKLNIGGIATGGATNIDALGGVTLSSVDVDTGSRGLFVSQDTLGAYGTTNSSSFAGTIDLTSSKRVYTGYYTTTPVNFNVTDQSSKNTIATANIPVLNVTTLGSESNGTATYNVATSAPATGTLNLVGGGTINYTTGSFTLTNGQAVSYTNNLHLLPSVSNFGIGFFVGGNTTTGPVGNNTNQIYNALLNLSLMTNGSNSMVSGYIVEQNKIQLGLTANTTNFAYTQLQPTGLTSTNSVPDWKPSSGQVVVNGVTNGPGEVILDTGIGYSFVGLTNPSGWNNSSSNFLSINLLNSAGGVGYNFNTSDTTNAVAPTSVSEYSSSNTYYNSGRNIFNAFNMLYDGQNGYMGLLTNNASGANNPNVFFQPGFYPSPVPEPSTTGLCVLGLIGLLGLGLLRGKRL